MNKCFSKIRSETVYSSGSFRNGKRKSRCPFVKYTMQRYVAGLLCGLLKL